MKEAYTNDMIEEYLLKLPSGLDLTFVASNKAIELNPTNNEHDFLVSGLICRINSLSSIKAAGSGHIGSSFSVVDLLLGIRLFLFDDTFSISSRNKNILFSSKGHDAPGIYAVMNLFNEIPDKMLHKLRRLDGLPGHPEYGVYNIPVSTGSLGMGISKAKGLAYSKIFEEDPGYVVVILGDGELQEGQIWESLPGAVRDGLQNIVAIVDGNKIQSDTWVDKTLPLGDLRKRVEGTGWKYHEMDGHDFVSLKETFNNIKQSSGPHFVYANTQKGHGVSFFSNFPIDGKFYKYHSGAPSDHEYQFAIDELKAKLNGKVYKKNAFEPEHFRPKERNRLFIQIWSELINEWGKSNSDLIVLDADLSFDTGTYGFRENFPERYIQCGIAEQDMVSIAGGLALAGKKPIVHSFSSFLTTRPLEQIYNNLCEGTNICYVGFLAGILPSAPGHSHQAVSDVGIITSLPNFEVIEPSCEKELIELFKREISVAENNIYLRFGSTELPPSYIDELDNLFIRKFGNDKLIITSGPAMTNIALEVARLSKYDIAVVTKPIISRTFTTLETVFLNRYSEVLVIENYLPTLGSSYFLQINNIKNGKTAIRRIGVSGVPRNGWTEEVLDFHELSANKIIECLGW